MRNKKKVLINLTGFGNVHFGFGQVASGFAKYLRAALPDDLEFVFLFRGSYVGRPDDGIKYVRLRWFHRYFPFFLPAVDVWHDIHQYCKVSPWSGRTKRILTVHDLNFLYEKPPKKARKYLCKLRRKAASADVLTAISEFTAEDIRTHLNVGQKQVRVIYNGVENLRDLPEVRPSFVADPGRKFFFTIGQVRRKKNFHVLLDAMRSFPDTDLYIVGERDGFYAEQIFARIAGENIRNVFLVGVCTESEKVWLYRHCHAFLFPSLFEGFGLPVVEAMQFGKPVFAARSTSLPEICGGHAFLWERFEPEYLSESIKDFLKVFYADEKRAEDEMKYADTFDYGTNVEAYVNLYRALAQGE
ncbi:MAG: glycosyltransferase family 4 protein [Dysgonamonadaceae bacterium]|jgi:glycosyltransferase involved in cell wall biosynthesis|nr:glycosyltransferase family 4 protein [Dysgonamonadaceae bacterium]